MLRVQKADGTLENFDDFKIHSSLIRAGIDNVTANAALFELKKRAYDGIPTKKIYKIIYSVLEKKPKELRLRYSLKKAIMDLGPTGYPFELFVAGVLKHYGYKTQVGSIVSGKCISHEIDIIAEKEGKKMMIECKFHNHPGAKSGIRTALYTYARFLDVQKQNSFEIPWLVTNTKVTSEAISYAGCTGMKILSWNYPHNFSLRLLIEKARLYPLTIREDLTFKEKEKAISEGKVFLNDLNSS